MASKSGHTHSASCPTKTVVVCGTAEHRQHDNRCYDKKGNQICRGIHTHDHACKQTYLDCNK